MAQVRHDQHNGKLSLAQRLEPRSWQSNRSLVCIGRTPEVPRDGQDRRRGASVVSAIVSTVPLGLGIALNPIAIVAGIFILRTTNARANGVAFAIGWLLGMALLAILPAWLVQVGIGPLPGVV